LKTRTITFLVLLLTVAMLISSCSAAQEEAPAASTSQSQPTESMEDMEESTSMEGMDMGDNPAIPAGLAYLDGQEIRFVHTEVSDPDVAKLLTDMMASPVILVPALAQAPDSMLANVYVFKNGIPGMGPLGFQPDVFDNPPGTEGYSPLRKIIFLTWADESKARELKSLAEVQASLENGELSQEISNVVVNMPFVVWPGGSR